MRRRPYSVLLFDEVEKGHKSVLNVLLQVRPHGDKATSRRRHVCHGRDIPMDVPFRGQWP